MKKKKQTKLNEIYSTAISGNDLLSSILYIAGIAAIFAGIYSPIIFVFVTIILLLYRVVYREVVEALPVDGGSYNGLLNATSKSIAAISGVFTFLSYLATAVISAKVGVDYLRSVLPGIPAMASSVALLVIFALLVISGLKDSAKAALGIFSLHFATLIAFVIIGGVYAFSNHSFLQENLAITPQIISANGSLVQTIYLGVAASLLAASGFETSANFVEEQKPGVYKKTLRNMIFMFGVFYPIILLIILNSMSIPAIIESKEFVLSKAAEVIGGKSFQIIVAADSFIVMAGTVLTSYIGVSGLVQRMSADGSFPSFLAVQNKKDAYPRIVIGFLLICISILFLTKGNLISIAGVYAIAFLGVMASYAFANIILKEARTELKRPYTAPIFVAIIAFIVAILGIIGNIKIDPMNLTYFEIYFFPTLAIIFAVIYQDYLLRFLLKLTANMPQINKFLESRFQDMIQGEFVAFIKGTSRLYEILEYINRNETGWNITLVHCDGTGKPGYDNDYYEIKRVLPYLKESGVFPHFNIKLVYKKKPFSPEVIDEVSKELNVRKNRILVGSIKHKHEFDYSDLGGVRIIF